MDNLLKGSGYSASGLVETINKLRTLADDLEAVCNGSVPSSPEVSVSNWLIARRAVPCLVGNVRGHPTVRGKAVATTEIFFMNEHSGLARTFSRWYRLGNAVKGDGEFH